MNTAEKELYYKMTNDEKIQFLKNADVCMNCKYAARRNTFQVYNWCGWECMIDDLSPYKRLDDCCENFSRRGKE